MKMSDSESFRAYGLDSSIHHRLCEKDSGPPGFMFGFPFERLRKQ